jgi:hypothetical protein
MKLESLKEEKFKTNILKNNQLFMLNGGGTKTGEPGTFQRWENGNCYNITYSYDIDRGNNVITYHGFTNKEHCTCP